MKEYFEAAYALFFFKPYTTYPRRFEITCGVFAWALIVVAFIGFFK